ncbi:MAG: hypothetical protein QM747_01035 [Nocardioides sp.]
MSRHDVVTVLLALSVATCLAATWGRRAQRSAAVVALALLLAALLTSWSTAPAPTHPHRDVTVLAGVLALVGGGLLTTQVFALVEEPERVRRAGSVLRGGAWIGALERLGVHAAVVSGWGTGIVVVLAVKGLGRYPELRSREDSAVAERFIIGTFVSVLWAVGCAGVAVLTH